MKFGSGSYRDKASEQDKKMMCGSSSWYFWERLNLHRQVRAHRHVGGGCPHE